MVEYEEKLRKVETLIVPNRFMTMTGTEGWIVRKDDKGIKVFIGEKSKDMHPKTLVYPEKQIKLFDWDKWKANPWLTPSYATFFKRSEYANKRDKDADK